MITDIAICYDYFPTAILEAILKNDLRQGGTPFLSTEAIFHICSILCERRPIMDPEYERRKEEFWNQLQAKYFEPEENPE